MRNMLALTIATFVSAIAAPTGLAEPITFMFSGEVQQVFDPDGLLTGTVTIGTPFFGQYTFESSTPDIDARPRFGIYTNAILSVSGAVGGLPFGGPSSASNTISIHDGGLLIAPDDYHLTTRVTVLSEILPFAVFWRDSDGLLYSTDALPLVPPDLALLEHADVTIGDERLFYVSGPIQQITPEPGALALMVISGVVITLRQRKRRVQRRSS